MKTRKISHSTRKTQKNKKQRSDSSYWGYHLIVNAGNCDSKALRSASTIRDFSKTLVKTIDMVAFGKPLLVNFGTGNKKGYSLVQLIETSNITAHFVEETNDIYLDVFSCKTFDPKVAIETFKEFFHPGKIQVTFLKRQARH
jgi:S-adenosylmethionine/arginine decarboxylase-like enzyme